MVRVLPLFLLAACAAQPSLDAPDAWSGPTDGTFAPPALHLTVGTFAPSVRTTLTVTGAAPGQLVWLAASRNGVGDGPCPDALGGLCLGLQAPVLPLTSVTADGEGVATFRITPPALPLGTEVGLQAVTLDLTASQAQPVVVAAAPATPDDLEPGELVITEVMQNPALVADANGEWFEVHNRSGRAVDLLGLVVHDEDRDAWTADVSAVVPAGGYVVLARDGDPALNGGVTADLEYTGIDLSNSDDTLVLESASGTVLDRVSWDDGVTFPDPTGAAMSLDGDRLVDGASGSAWCEAVHAYGLGDLGTPGAPNPACPEPTCDDGLLNQDEIAIDCGGVCGLEDWYRDLDGDGLGDPATRVDVCGAPAGDWVRDGADCDDSDPAGGAGTVWYADADADGYGDPAAPSAPSCEPPPGFIEDDSDCDDDDPAINPGAVEWCDGLDTDCDGWDGELDVPGVFPTIQAAVDLADPDDIVCVAPGVYVENVLGAGPIRLAGAGPDATVLVPAEASLPALEARGEGVGHIEGLSIQGGGADAGAGAELTATTLVVRNVWVSGQRVTCDSVCEGALSVDAEDLLLEDVHVSDVEFIVAAEAEDHGASIRGGGLYLQAETQATLVRVSAETIRITADDLYNINLNGGAIRVWSPSILLADVVVADVDVDLSAARFQALPYGVGMYIQGDVVTADRVRVSGVSLLSQHPRGVGLYAVGIDHTWTNLAVVGNAATCFAPPLLPDAFPTMEGAGAYIGAEALAVTNATFHGNSAVCGLPGHTVSGGGLSASGIGTEFVNVDISGNEVVGETTFGAGLDVGTDDPDAMEVRFSNVWGNTGADEVSGIPSPVGVEGNVAVDPEYMDSTPAFPWWWELTLDSGSALEDAGDPALLDPDGTRSDIGAHGGPGAW